jgi:hypothetical protein
VFLPWIAGDCDIAGNEMADKLAREGSAAIFCGTEPALPLSGSEDNVHLNNFISFYFISRRYIAIKA